MNNIFSTSQFILHRNRAIKLYPQYDYLFDIAKNNIIERLQNDKTNFQNILEVGSRSFSLTDEISAAFPLAKITACDNSRIILDKGNDKYQKHLIENELILLDPYQYDLVISSLYIHWINQLPTFLTNINHLLKDRGTAIIAFIGGSSLCNLKKFFIDSEIDMNKASSPHIAPLLQKESILKLFRDLEMNSIVVDSDIIEVEYQTCYELMRELSFMGESSCLKSAEFYSINKSLLNKARASKNFVEKFEIIYCSYFKN